MSWKFEDFSKFFFAYIERVDESDLLWPLSEDDMAFHRLLRQPMEVFKQSLQSAAHAATVPMYVGLMSAATSRSRSMEGALRHAKASGHVGEARLAAVLSKERHEVEAMFDAFKTFHVEEFLSDPFDDLLRQTAVAVWGAFELVVVSLTIRAVAEDPACLTCFQGNFWKRNARSIHRKLDTLGGTCEGRLQFLREMPLTVTMEGLEDVESCLLGELDLDSADRDALITLQETRHLIVHRGGVVDRRFLEKAHADFALGRRIYVAPVDLECSFRAVVRAGVTVAKAVEGILPP